MPTYAQLDAEPVWRAQAVPPNLHAHLIAPLRSHFNLGPQAVGAPGDNRHLRGRHRSARWCRTSRYCTGRDYATTDRRDLRGDQDWYRAIDVGITGERLQQASRRVDALVRAGRLPGLAEWFGTFNGRQVVGWFEGHPSSSDASHLYHLHLGFWTQFVNDAEQLRLLYSAITGEDDDMPTAQEVASAVWSATYGREERRASTGVMLQEIRTYSRAAAERVLDQADLAAIANAATVGVLASADELVAAIVAKLPAGALTRDDVEAAVREAFQGGLAPDAAE